MRAGRVCASGIVFLEEGADCAMRRGGSALEMEEMGGAAKLDIALDPGAEPIEQAKTVRPRRSLYSSQKLSSMVTPTGSLMNI
jgi:hypothetical protein